MSSVRLQIVEAMAAAAGAAMGVTPYRNLDMALESRKLPALAVDSGPDGPSEGPGAFGALAESALVNVHILVARSANPEAEADAYEAAIHAALFSSFTFGGKADLLERVSGEWDFAYGDCVRRSIGYRVTYRHKLTDITSN